MNLYSKCLNVLAQENVIYKHINNVEFIPEKEKAAILQLLCKRGLVHDPVLLSKLVCSRVTEMDLSECYVFDELLHCLQKCKFLKRLDLGLSRRQSRSITSESLKLLFPNLNFLRILVIPQCKEVNDDVMELIVKNCKFIKELHIPNSSISDESLHQVAQNLKYLNVLNVSGNEITDSGMFHLIHGITCQTLRELSIKDTKVTNKGVMLLTENLSNLMIFDFGSYGSNETLNPSSFQLKMKQIFWTV